MKYFFTLFFVILTTAITAQIRDLIITHSGDSLLCKIDSVSEVEIYFKAEYDYKPVHTLMKKKEISNYIRNAVNKNNYILKSGTSFILKEYKSLFDSKRNSIFLSSTIRSYKFNYERIIPFHKMFGMGLKLGIRFNNRLNLNDFLSPELNFISFGPKNNLELGSGYLYPVSIFYAKLGYKYHGPAGTVIKIAPILYFNRYYSTFGAPGKYIWGEISIGKSF